jgi:hypothetical protein
MKNSLIFYGLLFFSKKDINPNFKVKSFNKKYEILLKNAYNLANSLKKQKLKFVLLTNSLEKIRKFKKVNFIVKKINFKKKISSNTPFYTAHYKLDVFKYFEKQKHICCLLDLDVVAINKISKHLIIAKNKNINLVYDLNDQQDKNYNSKIIKTLKLCNNLNNNYPNWYGGEFIFGNRFFFREINNKIKIIYPKYIKNLDAIHHIGDETIVNAALQIMKKEKKIKFKDIAKKKSYSKILEYKYQTQTKRARLLVQKLFFITFTS